MNLFILIQLTVTALSFEEFTVWMTFVTKILPFQSVGRITVLNGIYLSIIGKKKNSPSWTPADMSFPPLLSPHLLVK